MKRTGNRPNRKPCIGCVLLMLLCCLLLTGCVKSIKVEFVFDSSSAVKAPSPAPRATSGPTPAPTPKAEERPAVITPAKFQSAETLPPETAQVINPEKATYERFGIDKSKKKTLEDAAAEGKQLPILYVTTEGEQYILSKTEYSSCVIDVYNCPEEWALDEASAGIRLRGNSSSYYGNVEKIMANSVPYRIKFDTKTNLLGLNSSAKCKSWVLLKAGYDIVRNDFAFRLGRTIMNGHAFCSDAAFVHLYVNDQYQGVYTLCEQCQVNKHRVNVAEPKEGYTGIDVGYYIVIDNIPDPGKSFKIDYGKYNVTDIEGEARDFVSTAYTIKSDVNTQGQIDFIAQYTKNAFEIVYQACENNKFMTMDENFDLTEAEYTSAQETVDALLDIDSVVDMYLLYEIMHDYDVGEGSFYMCVDFSRDSSCPKLQFTSPWDFNWTCEGSTERYWAGAFCESSFVDSKGDRSNPWFILLIKQNWFRQRVMEKWTEMAKQDLIGTCFSQETGILEAYNDEFISWDKKSVKNANKVLDWLTERVKWMDSQFLMTADP